MESTAAATMVASTSKHVISTTLMSTLRDLRTYHFSLTYLHRATDQ